MIMESTVRLYSSKIGEISKFLNKFFNTNEYILNSDIHVEDYTNKSKSNDNKTNNKKNNNSINKIKNDNTINATITNVNKRTLEWEKNYRNPVEIADIIGALIENNDKYSINMWISIDEGLFINVTDYNADEIIRYLYERFPW